ncbi:MAG: hypothetical protein FVQ81_14685 [Candidatus Glassbacteria bacterium]|nr:hypothetical protein [Candidatus Glassbacteria bacterium]
MTVLLIFLACLTAPAAPAVAEITMDNVRFVQYPQFPDAHSTWRSIGYSTRHRKVYIGVTNHRDKVGLFEYDVPAERMRLVGFIPELANLRHWQWQGKVHTQILEGADGRMYFATDGGEGREEYLMNHPQGYYSGMLLAWDPATERMENLGTGLPNESIKDIAMDLVGGLIYGVSYPSVHLLLFDPRRNDLRDLGRVGSDHVPRCMFSDRWGNGYYVDWRQRLVKYERDSGRILFSRESVPWFPGTTGPQIVTGIPTYAKDPVRGIIYLITYSNMLVAFHPQRRGIGTIEALGPTVENTELPPPGYSPNSAFGDNGKLYYFVGGHGRYVVKDTTLLMEYDPETRARRVVLKFPIDVVSEVTGCDVKDEYGNMYFCGRRRAEDAAQMGESGASRPFMLIFNPDKEISE